MYTKCYKLIQTLVCVADFSYWFFLFCWYVCFPRSLCIYLASLIFSVQLTFILLTHLWRITGITSSTKFSVIPGWIFYCSLWFRIVLQLSHCAPLSGPWHNFFRLFIQLKLSLTAKKTKNKTLGLSFDCKKMSYIQNNYLEIYWNPFRIEMWSDLVRDVLILKVKIS